MDTKSTKWQYTIGFKGLMVALGVCAMLGIGYGLLFYEGFDDALSEQTYIGSIENQASYHPLFSKLSVLLLTYRSEEHVLAGGSLTDQDIAAAKTELANQKQAEIDELHYTYNSWIKDAQNANNAEEVARLKAERSQRMDKIEVQFEEALARVEENLIQMELANFNDLRKALAEEAGFVYDVSAASGERLSNMAAYPNLSFEDLPDAYVIDNVSVRQIRTDQENPYLNVPFQTLQGYIGKTQKQFDYEEALFIYHRDAGRIGILVVVLGSVVFLFAVVGFLMAVGRTRKTEGIVLTALDAPYLDIATILLWAAIGGLVAASFYVGERLYEHDMQLFYLLESTIVTAGTLLGAYWLRLVAKRFKRKELFRHTLCFKILHFLFGGIVQGVRSYVEALSGGSITRRLAMEWLWFAILIGLALASYPITVSTLSFIGFGFSTGLLATVIAFGFHRRLQFYRAVSDIRLGVEAIKQGHLEYRIDTSRMDQDTRGLAEAIHAIADGYHISLENALKAERMKSELVSNVSHDLKTPLTSLITYVDLIKSEGVDTEQGKQYLGVVEQKVERLRVLIEDLFEASKASSGEVQVDKAVMDFSELLVQGFGEIGDRIEGSDLDFKLQIAEKPLLIEADGKLLWRVMENLISNALKYSLPRSRVYIQLAAEKGQVVLAMKNVSAAEIHLPPQELTERFKRGDDSRHTDGSGLGLAIAKSLTELMQGTFKIEVDGDLFKVILSFKQCEGNRVTEQAAIVNEPPVAVITEPETATPEALAEDQPQVSDPEPEVEGR